MQDRDHVQSIYCGTSPLIGFAVTTFKTTKINKCAAVLTVTVACVSITVDTRLNHQTEPRNKMSSQQDLGEI